LNRPLVTIGLAAYNAADTIERAVMSALSQTWRPIEIVVVDDCSSDGTREILERLSRRHSVVRVFHNAVNGGVAVSRNRILAEARGEFVAFFDDDDESLPERIVEQHARITGYEKQFAPDSPVICHTARKLVYPRGEEQAATMGQIEGKRAPAGIAVARRILLGAPLEDAYGACPTCSQMARLSTYKLVGGFDPSFRRSEDTDFSIRLAEAGGHFVGIGRPLVIQTMTRSAEKSLAEEYRNTIRLMEKHRAIIEREGQYDFCRDWLEAKQAWLERRRVDFIRRLLALALTHPVLTLRRLALALPNANLNRAFSGFYAGGDESGKLREAGNKCSR
jgi:glycosyltransferase involved in cell wall biosynthesis